jgi:hypothetical protein
MTTNLIPIKEGQQKTWSSGNNATNEKKGARR